MYPLVQKRYPLGYKYPWWGITVIKKKEVNFHDVKWATATYTATYS